MKNKTRFQAVIVFAICGLAVPSCVPANRPSGSATAIQSTTALAPGFYRKQDDATVFKIDANRIGCVVRDPDQMNAFGGFSKVSVLDSTANVVGALAAKPGYCAWPDGYYRVAGETGVYRVTRGTACKLNDSSRATAVRAVSNGAHFPLGGSNKACS